ncbi:MAG: NAD(P)/FAD-dependent oxidoreductase [Nevskiaceae bacterium]|nr:MAG: NAD(P)/FAD-dependent oxidoreductase [Nevskiaceae bacterium]
MAKNSVQTPSRPSQVRVAIVGTGFAGLGMAIQLKQAGETDFVVLEKAGDVGGTWRDNHYPGCACDVQSHLYSFSFEPNPEWSRMFAPQPEIWAYLRKVTDKHGLRPFIRFNSEVTGAEWDEAASLWRVRTTSGTISAQVLVSGMGGLSRAAYPDIPGIERFQGKRFHSQDWDHGYDLAGKRIAVIGTGASAIQFVPQIQKKAAHIDLYQRTPPWIMPKPDRPISDAERFLFKRFPAAQAAFRNSIYWMLESRVLGFAINPRLMKLVARVARSHIRKQIRDPELRKKVTPDYTIGCKRVLISDDYYPALAQPNVDVITTGIREITAKGVITSDGVEREVDAIIFGTGFHAVDPLPAGMIHGRDGVDIMDAWKNGAEAYKGTTVTGFPNLFLIVGPNVGLGHSSMVYMIESQIAYIMDALKTMQRQSLASVEVQPQAQADYNRGLQAKLGHAVWNVGGCKSWYIDPKSGKNVTLWPGFTWQFRRELKSFDAQAYRLDSRKQPAAQAAPTYAAAK